MVLLLKKKKRAVPKKYVLAVPLFSREERRKVD